MEGSLLFGKGEIPVIVFGVLFAMLFIFGAARPIRMNGRVKNKRGVAMSRSGVPITQNELRIDFSLFLPGGYFAVPPVFSKETSQNNIDCHLNPPTLTRLFI